MDVSKIKNISEHKIPNEYICPISKEIMYDPMLCEDGINQEKECIEKW